MLSDTLLARIRRLRPRECVIALQVAAIASRPFDERFLAAVLGGPEDAYLEPVRDAVVAQVLHADGANYRFRHGLFAEAVVADLTPGERRRLHARIAAALDAQPDLAEGGQAWEAGEAADHWHAADRSRGIPRFSEAALAASEDGSTGRAGSLGSRRSRSGSVSTVLWRWRSSPTLPLASRGPDSRRAGRRPG